LPDFHIMTAYRGSNGASEDKYAQIDNGNQLFVHSYALHKSDPSACVYSSVIETEFLMNDNSSMRTLIGRAEGQDASWANNITMMYFSSILIHRINEGWKLVSAGNLIAYISKDL